MEFDLSAAICRAGWLTQDVEKACGCDDVRQVACEGTHSVFLSMPEIVIVEMQSRYVFLCSYLECLLTQTQIFWCTCCRDDNKPAVRYHLKDEVLNFDIENRFVDDVPRYPVYVDAEQGWLHYSARFHFLQFVSTGIGYSLRSLLFSWRRHAVSREGKRTLWKE